ncbi:hypothetical protein GCM10009760_17120 [Kitasatospora kazusensis]|uniref:Uncharacterized protein n=1 Tax=Kitasatospora kazusensis TaxID=407974 RepID=A0ABP5KWP2_9ACTN
MVEQHQTSGVGAGGRVRGDQRGHALLLQLVQLLGIPHRAPNPVPSCHSCRRPTGWLDLVVVRGRNRPSDQSSVPDTAGIPESPGGDIPK